MADNLEAPIVEAPVEVVAPPIVESAPIIAMPVEEIIIPASVEKYDGVEVISKKMYSGNNQKLEGRICLSLIDGTETIILKEECEVAGISLPALA